MILGGNVMSKHLSMDIRVPIELDNPSIMRFEEKCIKCCACVKSCTQQARVYDTPFAVLLSQCFTRQKEPKTIL